MNISGLRKGDRLLIRDGRKYSRIYNPVGQIMVTFKEDIDGEKFYADGPTIHGYWYKYDEIVAEVPRKPRKGKLIGGYPIQ